MSKHYLAHSSGLAALCIALAMPATAQAAEAAATAKPATAEDKAPDDIIVTGSARAERRFDVSYAVNSLGQDDVQKMAPLNYADMLGNLPGIHVESTGGEVQNITRVRGIPTDRGYLAFQQDGLPLFPAIDGFFWNSGEGVNRYDLMTERVEVVRGGPAPIYGIQAAAIANNITVTGSDVSRGKAQVTIGDTGLYRLDAMQSGKISDRTYYAVGGFIRRDDGARPDGFPNDQGGQIRANIKRDLDNGSIKFTVNYLNDHNVFYLPIPLADPNMPSRSLDPYINFFSGTTNTPALRNVNIKYVDGSGVTQNVHTDLSNGRHIQFGNVGLQYEADFGGWHVSAKGGLTKGKLQFDALYSTTNPVDGNSFAASKLAASKTEFGAVTSMGYTLAGTNTAYDPYSQSGMVMQAAYRYVTSSFSAAQGDLSIGRKFETGLGTHDVKIGGYVAFYSESMFQLYQNYLMQVTSNPQLLDLNAYSATGTKLGSVTQNGVLNQAATLNQGNVDATAVAFYGNDTWQITPKLRIDAGLRHEIYNFNGYGSPTVSKNLGDMTTLADNATRAFTGTMQSNVIKTTTTNWTVGANYDLNRHLGGYVRLSHLEIPPSHTVAFNATPPVLITTKLEEYEAGIKASFGRSYLYLTGFYTRFDPLNASFAPFNPVTGTNDVTTNFVGKARDYGVEADGSLQVTPAFSIKGSATISQPEYTSLVSSTGVSAGNVNGNQIIREPKFYGNIRPSYSFAVGEAQFDIFGKYDYVGKRYVDYLNQTVMPAYGTFSAGITATYANVWQMQVIGNNLTNAHGITEGNPRADVLGGQGTATAVYGRPLFGRSFRVVLSRKW